MIRRLMILLFLLAAPASASDDDFGLTDIPVEDWRAMAAGRTLSYSIDGQPFGLEYYAPSGDGVIFQHVDGTCLNGYWTYDAGAYCYFWDGEDPVCFRHAAIGDTVFVIGLDDGVETGEFQIMTGISDVPIICDGLVS